MISLALLCASVSVAKVPDEKFIDSVERDTFRYFVEQVNNKNGLIKDSSRSGSPCSIAAVGFGLTALCIGVERKWIPKNEGFLLVLKILQTFRYKLNTEHGFYYHFLNMDKGNREWSSEVSSVDTALFLAGALTCADYFKDTEVEKLANEIYERVDWPWMMNGKKVLCMGWKPETGFLPYYWDSYSELMIIYALAIGSPAHPIPSSAWNVWLRPTARYGDYSFVNCATGSLFTYQYSHAWIDFRNKEDSYTDYWSNSVKATLVNKQYCRDRHFRSLGDKLWGVTACVGPYGYKGYGAGPGYPICDGTIAPSAVAGSVPFAPKLCIDTLKYMKDNFGPNIYGDYGFVDGFNVEQDWWANEYLGIDQGITLLMIENYRTGFVWEHFMRHPAISRWMSLCMKERKDKDDNEDNDE